MRWEEEVEEVNWLNLTTAQGFQLTCNMSCWWCCQTLLMDVVGVILNLTKDWGKKCALCLSRGFYSPMLCLILAHQGWAGSDCSNTYTLHTLSQKVHKKSAGLVIILAFVPLQHLRSSVDSLACGLAEGDLYLPSGAGLQSTVGTDKSSLACLSTHWHTELVQARAATSAPACDHHCGRKKRVIECGG